MGNLFDYKSEPVSEEVELRDEAAAQRTPQKKRKRDIGDDFSSDEGIINPETPRYAFINIVKLYFKIDHLFIKKFLDLANGMKKDVFLRDSSLHYYII